MMDRKLLEILGCPADKGELEVRSGRLVCKECGREYAVINGIPQMLLEDCSIGKSDENDTVIG